MPKTSKTKITEKQLKKLLAQPGKKDLLWYHGVGKCVRSLCPSGSRSYGEGRIQKLAADIGKADSYADTLWKTRSFYEQYTRTEARTISKPETSSGFVLTWSHMVLLLSLDDDIDRLDYQEACIDSEWSTKVLRGRIKEFREPRGKGGRRFRKPKKVEDALRQLIHESRTWDRRYHEVWFSVDDPAIRLVTGKDKTEDVSERAAEAIEILKTIQFDLKDALLCLKDLAGASKKKGKRRTQKRG